MKTVIARHAALVTALLVLFPVSLTAQEFPRRKAGLWEIKMSAGGAAPDQTIQQCIDAATDAQMQNMMGGMSQQNCSKHSTRKEGSAYISESVCTAGGSEVTSKATFTGDFEKSYSGEVHARYSPPMAGLSESKMTFSARHMGECKPDQSPGDIIMSNGMKMNILRLAKGASQIPEM